VLGSDAGLYGAARLSMITENDASRVRV
jgi:hypothetical protein